VRSIFLWNDDFRATRSTAQNCAVVLV